MLKIWILTQSHQTNRHSCLIRLHSNDILKLRNDGMDVTSSHRRNKFLYPSISFGDSVAPSIVERWWNPTGTTYLGTCTMTVCWQGWVWMIYWFVRQRKLACCLVIHWRTQEDRGEWHGVLIMSSCWVLVTRMWCVKQQPLAIPSWDCRLPPIKGFYILGFWCDLNFIIVTTIHINIDVPKCSPWL